LTVSSDSVDSVIRGNLCVENGRSPREAERQGAMFFSTIGEAKLRGIEVYGNTVFWDPPIDTAAIVSDAAVDPSAAHTIRNNLVVARSGRLVRSSGEIQFLDNEYIISSAISPSWSFDGKSELTLADAQAEGQERGSTLSGTTVDGLFHPTRTNCKNNEPILQHDIFGDTMSSCVGAVSSEPGQTQRKAISNDNFPAEIDGSAFARNGWSLIAKLAPESSPAIDSSRRQMAVLKSMEKQFGPLGLQMYVISDGQLDEIAARNWESDWNFGQIRLLRSSNSLNVAQLFPVNEELGVVIVDRTGGIVKRWRGLTSFPALELWLRQTIGTPVGMQTIALDAQARKQ
jgi:hypothetical protein